jgi:hypothetical protein
MKITSIGKNLDYKVVDLVECYNFSYKVYLHPSSNKKNYKFLKTDWTPTVAAHGGSSRYMPSSPMVLDV